MKAAPTVNGPLVSGRYYTVPCVNYHWHNRLDWWPVLGPRHKDKAFLNFDYLHYHIDGRFLTYQQRRYVLRWEGWSHAEGDIASILESYPLNRRHDEPPPDTPTMMRRRCWRADLGNYRHADQPNIKKIAAHFAGHQCRASEDGWICPHQAAPLGSIIPTGGVIVCPLHGLRIDAKTGVVLK